MLKAAFTTQLTEENKHENENIMGSVGLYVDDLGKPTEQSRRQRQHLCGR
jgi:hypothetical protein